MAFSNSQGGKLVVSIKDNNNAIYLLPYTGVGSSITRAHDEDVNVTFMNNDKAQEFVITVWRGESNQVEDHDTRLRHSDTNLDTDHDTFVEDHDTIHSYHDTKRVPLTNKQKDIVNFCSVPRTSREILERAGVVYHTKKNIAKYITSLVAAGYLQMTNPENPTASNQKYNKVTTKYKIKTTCTVEKFLRKQILPAFFVSRALCFS